MFHLAARFVTSLVATPPRESEVAWVADVLTPSEFRLWDAQPRYDRRHTYRVARRVEDLLAERDDRDVWVAAALLHDVGKVEARIGLVGRVLGTVTAGVVGRRRMARWVAQDGLRGRLGRYVAHGEIGGRMIREAGGRPQAARWAEVHHRMGSRERVDLRDLPAEAVQALKLSDRA